MLICLCNVDPPYTPLLYTKVGVYKGKHDFLIFALKQRLWVLVRTTIYVLCKNKKNIEVFRQKSSFLQLLKIAVHYKGISRSDIKLACAAKEATMMQDLGFEN